MRSTVIRTSALLSAALALLVVTSAASAAAPAYYPSGPQLNVSKSTVTAGGWTVCWESPYGDTSRSDPIATVLAACQGTHLMLAAASSTSATTYQLLAAAPRADVIFDTGTNTGTVHDANGSGWYYNAERSWGFAKSGDAVSKNSCDTASTNAALRLCWHMWTQAIQFGYRAGANTNLNSNTVFRRVLLVPNADTTAPVVTPTVSGTAGTNGWYRGDVTVSWSATDPESAVTTSGCTTSTVTSDTAGTTFTCTATSAGGTTTRSTTVKRDTVAPSVTLTAPAPTTSALPTFTGTAGTSTDDVASVTVAVYAGSTAAGSPVRTLTAARGAAGAWTVSSTPALPEGTYTVRATQLDNAGNTGASAARTFIVDTTPPTATIVRPGDGARYSTTQDVTARFSCADESAPAVVTCAADVDGVALADGANLPTTEGHRHTFTLRAVDAAGNAATFTREYRAMTFAQLALDDAPAAYFRLGDGAGSTSFADGSAGGHPGEFKNQTDSEPTGVSGDGNTARHFLGAQGYGFANGIAAPRSASTLLTWVKVDDVRDAQILDHGHENAIYLTGGRFAFRHMATTVVDARPGAAHDVVPDVWYLVAGRWDGTKIELFVADQTQSKYDAPALVATAASTTRPSATGSTFYLGYGQDRQWLKGSLDEVLYYDTALSDTHLAELWLADPPAVAGAQPATATPAPAGPAAVTSEPAHETPAGGGGAVEAAPAGSSAIEPLQVGSTPVMTSAAKAAAPAAARAKAKAKAKARTKKAKAKARRRLR